MRSGNCWSRARASNPALADLRRLVAAAALLAATPASAAQLAPASAPVAAYPGRAVLDAFRAACADLSTLTAAEVTATRAGFATYTPDKASPVALLLDFGMKTAGDMASDDATYKTDVRVMQRTIEGHQLDLMITDVTSYGTRSLGCRLVDFAATAAIPGETVREWAKATAPDAPKPTEINEPAFIISSIWAEGGLFPGHYKSQVGFVPQDSGLKQTFHLSGINLMTQARN